MLLDINAYVGHWPFMQLKYNTCSDLLKRMNTFGVDVSVITNLNGIFYKNTQSANEELYEELKSSNRYSSRFIPFAIINPLYAGWRKDLETCKNKFGMKGISLFPKYHDYEITEPLLIELVKTARDNDMPVAFVIRMVDSRQRSWMDIDYIVGTAKKEWTLKNIIPIIKEVPDAKYIIRNVANSAQLDENEVQLFKNANVVMDTSGRSVSNLGALMKNFGKDKFAFGTHSPILDYLTGQLRIEALREDEANAETKELLRYGNAKRILKL